MNKKEINDLVELTNEYLINFNKDYLLKEDDIYYFGELNNYKLVKINYSVLEANPYVIAMFLTGQV